MHHALKPLNNDKGIALFMALILSVIMLSITAAVLYMVIEGTQSSGREKRYKTALEASLGGLDISYDLISKRGATAGLLADLAGRSPVIPSNAGCVPNNTVTECTLLDDYDSSYKGITTKLKLPTSILKNDGTEASCWSGCDTSISIDPEDTATYDMSFKLGEAPNPVFDIFVKIVDATWGNSAPGTGLESASGVEPSVESIPAPQISYLYTIEVLSQAEDNPNERARTSVLYAY